MNESQKRLAWIVVFALLLISIIANIVLFRLWRNERQTSEAIESKLAKSERTIAAISVRIDSLETKQAEADSKAATQLAGLQAGKDRLKDKVRPQRLKIDSTANLETKRLLVDMDSLSMQLEDINVTQSEAFAVKVKTFQEVIRLEREKGLSKDTLLQSLGQENRQLKRDVKRERFRKNVWKALFGLGFVGAAFLATQ